MPSFRHDGCDVHYQDAGEGAPVVLLHAGASSSRQWRKVGAELSGDHRQLAPDLIGFGDTRGWSAERELTHDDQANLVLGLLVETVDGAVDVVGHSYGGATALRLALAVPKRVRTLTLIEPIAMPLLSQAGEGALFTEYEAFARRFIDSADAGKHEEAMEFFIDYRNGSGTWAAASEERRGWLLAVTAETADAFRSNLNNPTTLADCRSIVAPTLVVSGETTTEAERRVAEIIAEQVPSSRYEVVPEAGHMSALTHPAEVARLIDSQLAL
jgi:pimeloyl-ACP methyl ester carboxylesterase